MMSKCYTIRNYQHTLTSAITLALAVNLVA